MTIPMTTQARRDRGALRIALCVLGQIARGQRNTLHRRNARAVLAFIQTQTGHEPAEPRCALDGLNVKGRPKKNSRCPGCGKARCQCDGLDVKGLAAS